MHTKVVMFATVVGLVGMMASADAAPNRGTAGSQERKNWCDSKLRDCNAAAKETCEFTYPPSQSPACISDRQKNCDSSFGSNSTCTTAPLISQPGISGTLPSNQLPTTVAPSQPVPKPMLPKLDQTIRRRGVEGEQPTSSEKEGK